MVAANIIVRTGDSSSSQIYDRKWPFLSLSVCLPTIMALLCLSICTQT